jgi:predicted GNAT family N-acyltransferase
MTSAPAHGNRPLVTIKLASTSDELLQCYALRAAVFMGEQQCSYREEFDGNDYSASHLLLTVDGEPAGAMRIRWFAGFAKLERAIILKRYRSMGLFEPFVDWARTFAASKGYPKAYLHGQKRLWPIFERQGFRQVGESFHFSDHEYGAFVAELDVPAEAPAVLSDPMLLNRPEDRLDRPGILEESMTRGASNPHAEWTGRRLN